MASTEVSLPILPWLWNNYEVDLTGMTLRCKRCGQSIFYATRHAREAHGDEVEVQPQVSNPTPGRHYDDVPALA